MVVYYNMDFDVILPDGKKYEPLPGIEYYATFYHEWWEAYMEKYPNSKSMNDISYYYDLDPLDRHHIQYILWFNGIKKSRADTVKAIINNLKPIIDKINKLNEDEDDEYTLNYGDEDYIEELMKNLTEEEKKQYKKLEKRFDVVLKIFSDYTKNSLKTSKIIFKNVATYMNWEENFNQHITYHDMILEVEKWIVQHYITKDIIPNVNSDFSKVTPEDIKKL